MSLLNLSITLLIITMGLAYCMRGGGEKGGVWEKNNAQMCAARHAKDSKGYTDCMEELKGGLLDRATMSRREAEDLKKQLNSLKDQMKQIREMSK